MKKFLLICIIQCSVWSLAVSQEAYWENAPGPYGGLISYLHSTYSSLTYAINWDGSTYRSTDYGVNWAYFQIPSAQLGSDGEEVEIGVSGIFYSVTTEGSGDTAVRKLYCSMDEGISWQLKNPQVNVLSVRETPSGALLGFDIAGKMYRSSDTGTTWQLCFNEFMLSPPSTMNFLFANDGKMVFVTYQGPMYYSLDDGQTWALAGYEIYNLFVRPRIMPSGTLFKMHMDGDQSKFYRSDDWGFTWIACGIEMELTETPNSVVSLPSGRLLMTTNRHIFYSDDDGITWAILSTAQDNPDYLFGDPQLLNGNVLGRYKGTFFRSSDGGNNWNFSAYGIGLGSTQQLLFLGDSLQLAQTFTGLWRTVDGGITWSHLLADTSTNNPAIQPIAAINPDSFVVIINQNMLRTTDAGQTFENITPAHLLNQGVFKTQNGYLFTSDSSGILRSNDFGHSWQSSLPGETLLQLIQHPNGALFARTFTIVPFSNGTHRFRKSTDNGDTWEELSVPTLPEISDITISNTGIIYAIYQHQMAYSSNLGLNWTISNISNEAPLASQIALNNLGHIFVNGNQEIWASVDGGLSWYTLPSCPTNVSLLNDLIISPSGQLFVLIKSGSILRSRQSSEEGGYIGGQVLRDSDADCNTQDEQEPLKEWIVVATGQHDFFINTSYSGTYTTYVPPGVYDVQVKLPQNLWWSACDSTKSVQIGSAQTIDTLDFAVSALSECPLMSVDVGMPQLRRCFDNTVYVSYCNAGSEPADSAWVDVLLDPYLSLVSSAQPHQSLGNNI
ncbi:MAG: hypothetical protein LCH81_10975, partial [Bacteroidetes bacterium]|nr:hypothetical protein [Bacteroidota bacterium]